MAEPKIVKNIHIQQWNGDENFWSTQKPLMEGEIGIVNKPNTKNVANIVVGNGTSTTSELLAEGNVFYSGIGAGYTLPLASNTVLGGVKISDTYFYTDGEVLKLKVLKSIWDDNPDNPDEFNRANKSGNQALISTPTTDWKLQGDFYAETLYADEARIKNVVYDQETNISYLSKYLDIHKELFGEGGSRKFTIQLTPDHYYWKYGEYRPDEIEAGYEYDVNIEGYLRIPEQEVTIYTNTPTNFPQGYAQLGYNYPTSKDDEYNSAFPVEGSTWVKFELETSEYIGAIDYIHIRGGWGAGGGSGPNAGATIEVRGEDNIQYIQSIFKNNKYYTTIYFLYPRADWGNFEVMSVSYYTCTKHTYTISESLLSSGSSRPIVVDDDGNHILSISWVNTVLTIHATPQLSWYNGYASQNILTLYDDKTIVNVLRDNERAGIKIYNYHKDDQSVSQNNRRIAELSVDNRGILAYASDNSDLTNFSDVLMVNRYLDNIDGFVWLNSTPAQPVSLTYYNKIPSDKIDLASLSKLNMFLNQNNIGTYDPSSATEQNIAINTCTSIVANGTEHKVDTYGKITLADSTWTNELNALLSTAVQKITFDNVEYLGPTITLKSKIQKITLDDSEIEIDENGCVELKSKIQSITYDGLVYNGPEIVLTPPKVEGRSVNKGTGADVKQYTSIVVTKQPATNTYLLEHYTPSTIDEPSGSETHIIGNADSENSFTLTSNIQYDHYGHMEHYDNYTLDFSALVSRIQQLETKVAELEEQLKAS